jgi:UDP-N-acetylmuramate dehydrogenase
MNRYLDFGFKLKRLIGKDKVLLNESMKYHTSFKVGGPSDVMVIPENYEILQQVIRICMDEQVPFYVIGNGTNLLVKDKGIRGVVIKITKLDKITIEDKKLVSQSGALIADVSQRALEASLTGFEFACGIPGCVGGAVAMNAGAYISEIANVIESALIIDNFGEIRRLSKDELELGYRSSAVLKYGYTVLEASFNLQSGDYSAIKEKVDDLQRRRREKQPLEYPSAGSTFKRPEGFFAGKLIEDCGLKGTSIGGAEVSQKHSGFIINKGNAKAKDIIDLIAYVQKVVLEKFGVELHPEVRIIGED